MRPDLRPSAKELLRYINLKLAAIGQPTSRSTADPEFLEVAGPLLRNHYQKNLLLAGRLCPVDSRIQSFLDDCLSGVCPEGAPRLPYLTFNLDRAGMARIMSLPASQDRFSSPYLESYRVAQGVLHNPRSDRRTTHGIFHIVESDLPTPADKIETPRLAFARLLAAALRPPEETLLLPFTADQQDAARLFVTLLLRPLVCPATATDPAKTMEIRFFAPGSLISNLDFVEAIFGNGGDPYLPENDAALDAAHWTGHTGCVILAPHLVQLRKRDLGLPRWEEATERQRRDGMCWRDEEELYNQGSAFKVACRDRRGVMVTLIADNYFGYCKKEVKTQIGYAANLSGLCEEEHAGGALAFPSYVLGQHFYGDRSFRMDTASYAGALSLLEGRAETHPDGHATDLRYPGIHYVPEDAEFSVRDGYVRWRHQGEERRLTLRAGEDYLLPSGYRVRVERQLAGTAWRLVGTRPDGTVCHKPCTVSGGGKSEISKSIANALLKGPVIVRDYHRDLDEVAAILRRDFSAIYRQPRQDDRARRPILSPERSLGSVIKLLTPSPDYTAEHNAWVRSLPQVIRQLVFAVKRYYRPEWGDNWREHFTVDRINGALGNELKFDDQPLVANYLRVGYDPDGSWRIYKLRPDFRPANKVQLEDDITASVVLPRRALPYLGAEPAEPSVKLIANCEARLFQRPDDAIHRGVDKQAEADIAGPDVFLSNFEPLSREAAQAVVDHLVEFDRFSEPMKRLLTSFVESPATDWVVSSAHPRLVGGVPTKNPRYLQLRPDLAEPREAYLAEVMTRLHRRTPADQAVFFPVQAVLAGRRGNPAEPASGLPPLAVYNPIHYQELPELLMDFICSLTGKSPSTTGFGSEGALTKGPFNAMPAVIDVNNALVAAALTGYAGFTTAAGYVGTRFRVDHDISMLMPEIWCRMRPAERDPRFLIANGYLEKLEDFVYGGVRIQASRLGFRITERFADQYLGRIFENPDAVFSAEMLRPELQDPDAFAAGVAAIVEAQQRVARLYFEDGTVEAACPPLRALLHIMAFGAYEGKGLDDPSLRAMFSRESVLASAWYRERLKAQQRRDIRLWQRHVAALEACPPTAPFDAQARLAFARAQLSRVSGPAYLDELVGTIGLDPFAEAAAS